jgi:hypothetical protein
MSQNYSLLLLLIVDLHGTRPTSLLECQDGSLDVVQEQLRLFQEREDDETETVACDQHVVDASGPSEYSMDDDSDEGEQEPDEKKRGNIEKAILGSPLL